MSLEVGQMAPDFSLPDETGSLRTLAEFRGQWVLLYFYPKDDTPGCTTEACEIRDRWTEFAAAGIKVLGVSKDSVASHQKFAAKHQLPFTLLSDPDVQVITAYDAWKQKSMYGKSFLGIVRSSVLINPQGKIAKLYPKVSPKDHAQEILRDVAVLSSPQ